MKQLLLFSTFFLVACSKQNDPVIGVATAEVIVSESKSNKLDTVAYFVLQSDSRISDITGVRYTYVQNIIVNKIGDDWYTLAGPKVPASWIIRDPVKVSKYPAH
jgi:hypothetical protein